MLNSGNNRGSNDLHEQVNQNTDINRSDSPRSDITEKMLETQSVSDTHTTSHAGNNSNVNNTTTSETQNLLKAENDECSPMSVSNPQNESSISLQSDDSSPATVLGVPKPSDNDTGLSAFATEQKREKKHYPEHTERVDESSPVADISHSSIPNENEPNDSLHQIPRSNPQPTINGSPRPRERVKNNAEGHITSEPVSDNSDDPYARLNLSEIGVGVAVAGGVVTIGGVIVGSTFVTALGVTAVVIGGTCYFLEGK